MSVTSESDSRRPTRVVVVAGLSGAGRSTALRALEDLGYYCVDNLPPTAFDAALSACERDGMQRVALGVDVRVAAFVQATVSAVEELKRRHELTLLFLDASDATLLARFSSTRRPHPLRTLSDSDSERSLAVLDGIKIERERLAPLRADASLVLDTSELTVHDLRRRIVELCLPQVEGSRRMVTRFISFGFKYGTPGDCDMIFDVRFIQNPFFVPELKPLSGLDPSVAQYVRDVDAAQRFAVQAVDMLRLLVPLYEHEGKSYLTVGFGCTGGRHRSVAMAEWIAERLSGDEFPPVQVVHRDVERVVHS